MANSEAAFVVKANIGGDVYEVSGDTLADALLQLHPKRMKGFVKFEIQHGVKLHKTTLHYTLMRQRRLFSKEVEIRLLAKRLMVQL